jgi:phage terminase large subunit GpA-like protein
VAIIDEIEVRARRSFIPPPKLALADWLEVNVRLPAEVSVLQGPLELWPFEREIANAMTDPAYERISFVKGTRLGFSTLLTGTVAGFVVNDPSPIILILPTSDDCRDYVSSELDPIFNASPVLRDASRPGLRGI